MLQEFIEYLKKDDKSINTIKSYTKHVEDYIEWFRGSYGTDLAKLYRENFLDYISYLLNIKKLNAKSINAKIAALIKLNEYLVESGLQDTMVASKKDYMKLQIEYASPAIVVKNDVEAFRQRILENESKRDYALVTLLAYSGMRISEALNIKMSDMNLTAREILIRYGKGKKQRLVIINDKIVNAVKEYLKERENYRYSDSEFLFVSRESKKVDRTTINHIFNDYSNKITPHTLRHFFCSYALENGWAAHEVANQVGHSNIQTTLMYTHPSRDEMKRKSNLL